MPIYLRHRNTWLKLKEVYQAVQTSSRKRQRKQRSTSSSVGMLVAESVDKPRLNGLRYSAEIPVSATKVTRFAAHLFLRAPYITVVIEPRGDDYVAKVYARSPSELEQHKRIVEAVAREVGGMVEEEMVEEVEEEEGEEAE